MFIIRFVAGFFIAFVSEPNTIAADFPQGLVLHFNFDQLKADGVVADKTGHSNGRAFGAKWTAMGKQGGACEFTSTNSYIMVANTPSLNPTQATFAVWFRTSKSDSLERFILDKRMDNGFALGIAGESKDNGRKTRDKLCFVVSNNFCLGDSAVTDGLWHHGAATYDGANLKLYVDGKLQKQVVSWCGEIPANTNELTIGMNRSNPPLQEKQEKDRSFEGALDDLMIFNHALPEAEIQVVIASVKPKFTKEQVARRLVELKELYDRGLIVKDFYDRKAKECEVTP